MTALLGSITAKEWGCFFTTVKALLTLVFIFTGNAKCLVAYPIARYYLSYPAWEQLCNVPYRQFRTWRTAFQEIKLFWKERMCHLPIRSFLLIFYQSFVLFHILYYILYMTIVSPDLEEGWAWLRSLDTTAWGRFPDCPCDKGKSVRLPLSVPHLSYRPSAPERTDH